jgi:hypothetical protein
MFYYSAQLVKRDLAELGVPKKTDSGIRSIKCALLVRKSAAHFGHQCYYGDE